MLLQDLPAVFGMYDLWKVTERDSEFSFTCLFDLLVYLFGPSFIVL